jgi:glycosyltransferase involved in cell wall biosynthesis
MFSVRNRQISDTSRKEQYTWKYLSCALDKLDKTYDAAIGFLEKTSTYYCVDKVDAHRKIGWIHIDYDKLGMDPEFDIPYFRKLDNIVTVSEECSRIFSKRFPCQRDKIKVIYNVVSPRTIYKLAEDRVRDIEKKEGVTTLLTIGRLHYQKGYEMAVEACKILVSKGYEIKWYVIGEGEDREKITRLIDKYGMQNHFILLGLKSNPYPYINQADIYVQPSRFEGKSIAIDEAKILRKPIIVTNFSTAKDQIVNRETGLIVDMNPVGISNGIEELIADKKFVNTFYNNLSQLNLGTELEVEKLYSII